MVVGVVSVILSCCIGLFIVSYRSAMVQSARNGTAQAVSQVSNTVRNYLRDMEQAMKLVEQAMTESPDSRAELLSTFLKFRPDVIVQIFLIFAFGYVILIIPIGVLTTYLSNKLAVRR